jgi:hypothetical protein
VVSETPILVKGREAFDTKSDVYHAKRRKSDSPSHVKTYIKYSSSNFDNQNEDQGMISIIDHM